MRTNSLFRSSHPEVFHKNKCLKVFKIHKKKPAQAEGLKLYHNGFQNLATFLRTTPCTASGSYSPYFKPRVF